METLTAMVYLIFNHICLQLNAYRDIMNKNKASKETAEIIGPSGVYMYQVQMICFAHL